MIGNISLSPSADVQQYSAGVGVPSSSRAASSKEDSVQLSAETQQYLTNNKASTPAAQPSFSQIIKEAADGNIAAFAKLALIA
jgi:hypothetical protein